MMRAAIIAILHGIPAALVGAVDAAGQEPSSQVALAASARAHRLSGSISVDGRLSEGAWADAHAIDGFLQFEPDEGSPSTQPSAVRVLLGPAGIYIGAELGDNEPDRILRTLGRRDELNRADWFTVMIDPYRDRKTAFVFGVNAAGVQYDAVQSGDVRGDTIVDTSWNAIWESAVHVTADGWTVEIHIPYSVLRFSQAPTQTWGVHFSRRIARRAEISEWPLVRRTDRGNFLTRLGGLDGIEGVAPRRTVQVAPYAVMGLRDGPDAATSTSMTTDIGGDIRVGLGSAFTADLTVNPDFGQVEADPAELNLTAFETFFPEQRPFFVEGSQIYDFAAGPGSMLYTRRIGAAGPIIGAGKISGRTSDGLSIGILGASTGEDLRPDRYYGAARLRQEFGSSTAGAIVTGFDAETVEGRRRTIAGAADWDLRLRGNAYSLNGFVGVTRRWLADGAAEPSMGFAGLMRATRRQGALTYQALLDVFHHEFNPNDMGRITNSNFFTTLSNATYQINNGRPFGPFLRANVGINGNQKWTYREHLNQGLNLTSSSNWTLRSRSSVLTRVGVENPFGGYDLYQTRGLGPRLKARMFLAEVSFATDERKSWNLQPQVTLRHYEDGGVRRIAGIGAAWNVSPRFVVSGRLSGDFEDGVVDWSSNEVFRRSLAGWEVRAGPATAPPEFVSVGLDPAAGDVVFGSIQPDGDEHYHAAVFGARDVRAMDATLRSGFTFTPTLNVQVYGQLFVARAQYADFRVLRDRDTLVPLDSFPKRTEFSQSRFLLNSVLRWEYWPGSILYVVLTQQRRGEDRADPLTPVDPGIFAASMGNQISRTFDILPESVLMIKLSYTFRN